MKNILIIGLTPTLGGVETYIYNFIKHCDKTKYNFDFLQTGFDDEPVFKKDLEMILCSGEHFFYAPNLKKKYVKGKKWLKNFYNTHRYDVVYLNTCTAAKFVYCEYAVKKLGVKLISHSHTGLGMSKINNGIYRNFLNKWTTKKLSCSDLASKWLYGSKADQAEIIPNGVDVIRFHYSDEWRISIRKELKIREDEVIVGHVGRFSIPKNHKYFIELINKLPKNYRILCIGNGPLKNDFINSVVEGKCSNRFIILPNKNNIEEYYSAMDLFVMPSTFEGLPIVAVEAQACGLNCLFSDAVSKQTDLTGHCVFLPLGDVRLWSEEIDRMSKFHYDGVSLIKENKFDIQSCVSRVEEIIDSL